MSLKIITPNLVELPSNKFPREIEQIAKKLQFTDELFEHREEVSGFTVDDISSPDLDDAIHLRKTVNGWIAEITISDVDSLISKDSYIDQMALDRVASQYFGDFKGKKVIIPMLPKVLSEYRLSLHEAQLRPTITVRVWLNEQCEIQKIALAKSCLRSSSRMAHSDYQGAKIVGDPGLPMNTYLEFAKHLATRRWSQGSIGMQSLRPGFTTDEEGMIRQGSVSAANQIVQEFMILANTSVAKFFQEYEQAAPFRVHMAVDSHTPTRRQIIEEVERNSDYLALMDNLRFIYNKYLCGALYQPETGEHFGLGVDAYLHFTSPIRRYADLVNHRIAKALIDDTKSPYSREEIVQICEYLNARLRRLQTLRSIKSGKHSFHNYRHSSVPTSIHQPGQKPPNGELDELFAFQREYRIGNITFELQAKPGINIELTCTASARFQGKRYTESFSAKSDKATVKSEAARRLHKKLGQIVQEKTFLDKPQSENEIPVLSKPTPAGQLIDYCRQHNLSIPIFHYEIWGGGVMPITCYCRLTSEKTVTGYGPNTKLAKSAAAEKMLAYLKSQSS
ncbi:RNB domain-containing ribonuclease [Candidatus Peregrinibacteria bacterium]|nr:RNB domain-containing ribonuclease [Candidatus Peregrinibacteria bacterium]